MLRRPRQNSERPIRLRPLTPGDLATALRWVNDAAIMRTVNRVLPVTGHEQRQWYRDYVTRRDRVIFAIETVGRRPRYIGNGALNPIDWRSRKAELMIYIGPPRSRDRGYGTAAVAALLEFAFDQMNLHRVYLYTLGGNRRAQRAFAKCGFRLEGRQRDDVFLDGRYHDSVRMAILDRAFRRRPPLTRRP